MNRQRAQSGSVHRMQDTYVDGGLDELARLGWLLVHGTFAAPEKAWQCATELVPANEAGAPIEVIGDFVVPPPEGAPSRDFQTLHFDFGVPIVPPAPADVARYTALHVPRAAAWSAEAFTRLVPLRTLLGSRRWPDHDELVRRLAAYGDSHGAWTLGAGYAEGSFARIIEAALGQELVLPSVRSDPGFLCGTEFLTLADETRFFAQRGLPIDAVAIEVRLQPGELLLFDNLALAHGRRGTREPGELHQRVFGHRALHPQDQIEFRDRFLAAFTG
jgi:hypothetical protein